MKSLAQSAIIPGSGEIGPLGTASRYPRFGLPRSLPR